MFHFQWRYEVTISSNAAFKTAVKNGEASTDPYADGSQAVFTWYGDEFGSSDVRVI